MSPRVRVEGQKKCHFVYTAVSGRKTPGQSGVEGVTRGLRFCNRAYTRCNSRPPTQPHLKPEHPKPSSLGHLLSRRERPPQRAPCSPTRVSVPLSAAYLEPYLAQCGPGQLPQACSLCIAQFPFVDADAEIDRRLTLPRRPLTHTETPSLGRLSSRLPAAAAAVW